MYREMASNLKVLARRDVGFFNPTGVIVRRRNLISSRELPKVSNLFSLTKRYYFQAPIKNSRLVLSVTRPISMPITAFSLQKSRSLFIQTEETPNPASLKFLPGSQVLSPEYGMSVDFRKGENVANSPLAKLLFRIKGVEGVFFGPDFVTVSKSSEVTWPQLKPDIFSTLMDFFAEGHAAVTAAKEDVANEDEEDDDEVVGLIKELLEERIRPMVQEDGGDIFFRGFDAETGVVKVKLAGSCSGCPSSSITLKSGVENMLTHYIPEVTRIEEVMDEEELNQRKLSFSAS